MLTISDASVLCVTFFFSKCIENESMDDIVYLCLPFISKGFIGMGNIAMGQREDSGKTIQSNLQTKQYNSMLHRYS